MKSPVYPDVEMKKIVRLGIEIEYCPKSGGVWLDKGELEKLIELSNQNDDMAPQIGNTQSNKAQHQNDDDWDDDYNQKNQRPKKRESFLGEIFDIF